MSSEFNIGKIYANQVTMGTNAKPSSNSNHIFCPTNVTVNLNIDLPQIRTEFDNLKDELENLNSKLDNDLDKIQDGLDELTTNSNQTELVKPLNKLHRFLDKLSEPNSDYNKVITGTQKGIELAQKVGRTYNKFAQWLAMPQVPDLFLDNKGF